MHAASSEPCYCKNRNINYITHTINYFSVLINHHDQDNLEKKELNWAHGSTEGKHGATQQTWHLQIQKQQEHTRHGARPVWKHPKPVLVSHSLQQSHNPKPSQTRHQLVTRCSNIWAMGYTLILTIIYAYIYIRTYKIVFLVPSALIPGEEQEPTPQTGGRDRKFNTLTPDHSKQAITEWYTMAGQPNQRGNICYYNGHCNLPPNSLRISTLLNNFSWTVSFSTEEINLKSVHSFCNSESNDLGNIWSTTWVHSWNLAPLNSNHTNNTSYHQEKVCQQYQPHQLSLPTMWQPSLQPARNSTV